MKASTFVKHEKVTLDFSEQFPEAPAEETVLNLTVNPAALTPALEAEMQAAADVGQIVNFLTAIVVEWDMQGEDGNVLPLTYDGLKDVPVMVLALIINGVGEAIGEKTRAEGNS